MSWSNFLVGQPPNDLAARLWMAVRRMLNLKFKQLLLKFKLPQFYTAASTDGWYTPKIPWLAAALRPWLSYHPRRLIAATAEPHKILGQYSCSSGNTLWQVKDWLSLQLETSNRKEEDIEKKRGEGAVSFTVDMCDKFLYLPFIRSFVNVIKDFLHISLLCKIKSWEVL